MSKRIAVVISEDPFVTARPVEALRIALGLSVGDHEMTVVLLGRAPLLLMQDTEKIVDVDILFVGNAASIAPSFVKGGVVIAEEMVAGGSHPTLTYDDLVEKIFSSEHVIVL